MSETSLTVVYNNHFYATLLVTPADLDDFALGFSLSEGVVTAKSQIIAVDVVAKDAGLVLNISLEDGLGPRPVLQAHTQGHVNCFCMLGVRSGFRCETTTARKQRITRDDLAAALASASGPKYRAVFYSSEGVSLVREDEDNVNAFDKLAGAIVTAGIGIDRGFVAISGTASLDLVTKVATVGVATLAMSITPKAPAIAAGKQLNLALITLINARMQVLCGLERVEIAERRMPAA